ncbi:MAG TPA: UDP-3-O-(3-hydroxymyristoyl)glucosamine N-acyltransferase, partial [bacterium]|nr:UDP-3-O-(3-hydroxymyristoyl)glucosamine N-acyltransferase [bacterium]
MKLHELAAAIGGEAVGDREVEIVGVAEIASAGPGRIVMAADARRLAEAEGSTASAVLLPENLNSERKPAVRAKNIRLAFGRAIGLLHPLRRPEPGIHPTAIVGEGTRVESSVSIGPYAVIGEECEIEDHVTIGAACAIGDGVRIGEESILYPHVTVYARCIIGARVILHSGAVLGSDGFGYAAVNGRQVKIPHVGRVVIEDDVEIGANSAIDRATLGETRIGAGTKIDNLVQIGHNVVIGRDVVIAGQCGVSGSVTIGDRAVLAGKVGVVDHAI